MDFFINNAIASSTVTTNWPPQLTSNAEFLVLAPEYLKQSNNVYSLKDNGLVSFIKPNQTNFTDFLKEYSQLILTCRVSTW